MRLGVCLESRSFAMRLRLPIAGPGGGGGALVVLEVVERLEWDNMASFPFCLLAAVAVLMFLRFLTEAGIVNPGMLLM